MKLFTVREVFSEPELFSQYCISLLCSLEVLLQFGHGNVEIELVFSDEPHHQKSKDVKSSVLFIVGLSITSSKFYSPRNFAIEGWRRLESD